MSARSSSIAKQIQSAEYKQFAETLRLIIQRLMNAPLGPVHLGLAKKMLAEAIDHIPEKLAAIFLDNADNFPGLPPEYRQLNAAYTHLIPFVNNADRLLPLSERLHIAQRVILTSSRPLPLTLQAGHNEFRFIERTSHVLQYDDDDFRFAAAFSLALAHVLGKQLTDEKDFLPCVIPHTRGFFLGTAAKSSEQFRRDADAREVVHPYSPLRPRNKEMGGVMMTVPGYIQLNTFISFREFKGSQRHLHDLLMPFKDDQKMRQALDYGMDMYTWGTHFKDMANTEKLKTWHETCLHLQEITQSRHWQAHHQASLRSGKVHRPVPL